jgi:hypothetical protein
MSLKKRAGSGSVKNSTDPKTALLGTVRYQYLLDGRSWFFGIIFLLDHVHTGKIFIHKKTPKQIDEDPEWVSHSSRQARRSGYKTNCWN